MRKPIQNTKNVVSEATQKNYIEQEAIALRAYELWMSRGCPEGSSEVDWLQAETELSEQPAAARTHAA